MYNLFTMEKTILIVDDNDEVRIFLRKFLVSNNFRVLEASDGAEALDIVEKNHPDVVILDLKIPKVSGETVCVRIKEAYPEIIIIVVTAKSLSSDVVHGLQIGADDYVAKPFAPEELMARIDARLKATKTLDNLSKTSSPAVNKITLRESISLIAIRLIASQIIFGASFAFVAGAISLLGSYLGITASVSLYLVIFVILLTFNVIIVFFIIARWHFEYTEVTREGIIQYGGIFNKKKQKYDCNFVESIALDQSFLGNILNYGTIELYDPALKERIYLLNIANPKKISEIVEKILPKKTSQPIPFVAKQT